MSVPVDVIRFQRPQSSDRCLFISNLPTTVSREDLWKTLHTAFSQYGLLYQIVLPDKDDQNYGFVKFFSEYACRSAQRHLDGQLCVDGHSLRVCASRERPYRAASMLHVTQCQALANHYLGFNGWSTNVRYLEQHSQDVWSCEVVIQVKEWGVCSVGRGDLTVEPGDAQALGGVKKQVLNRACEDAFSKLVIALVQPGDRVAAVTVTNTEDSVLEISTPTVNVLPEGTYTAHSKNNN